MEKYQNAANAAPCLDSPHNAIPTEHLAPIPFDDCPVLLPTEQALERVVNASITEPKTEPAKGPFPDELLPNPEAVPRHVVGKSISDRSPAASFVDPEARATVTHLGQLTDDHAEEGLLRRCLVETERLKIYHCNIFAFTKIPEHRHAEEQFGFICQGSIALEMNDERFVLYQGDSYYIPSNVPYSYTALYDSKMLKIMVTPALPGSEG